MADDQAQSKQEHKDFFISYTSADRRWAEWIAWYLKDAGYSTILQAWDFHAGGNFVLDMDKATRQSERTIAVLSPDYFASRFTPSEWAAAFRRDPKEEQGILLCLIIENLLSAYSEIVICQLSCPPGTLYGSKGQRTFYGKKPKCESIQVRPAPSTAEPEQISSMHLMAQATYCLVFLLQTPTL